MKLLMLKTLCYYQLSTMDIKIYRKYFGNFNNISQKFNKKYLHYIENKLNIKQKNNLDTLLTLSREDIAMFHMMLLYGSFFSNIYSRNLLR